ncbi:electron transfer flavoprotein subunit alpha [Gluconacetobacter sacchari DSM 12717]|uniref:Electron transfer flavoprotein subunit alpha n=2 Tax=Gluconacetobacter sacchari TaxID=92759 RepID=A0A7W4IDQ9_9PROT|nr:FAD-binding protein [Gluconacetobacter sacchari]MBB2160985.1 electron transfer flavoprotein subunit alpha/FixB family protein [Gluconacetobacter sacchari]GBQ24499.1 electron transfer flavoprotein subunit alpha [Gluconacetobacter sacchari DSM 12717]
MTALVLLDAEDGTIPQTSRSAIAAAATLGEIDVLVTGGPDTIQAAAASAAKLPGIRKVRTAAGEAFAHGLAEPLAALIVALAPEYDHILAAATAIGKSALPRAAARLDVQIIPDVMDIKDAETFVRPIFAGNALVTLRSSDAKKLLTIRTASFDPVPAEGGNAPIEAVTPPSSAEKSRFLSAEHSSTERPQLEAARVIVSGGRGMQSAEGFKILEPLADKLGAAIGASRVAVDAGFVPNDYQVGQTGKIVAPDLYIACGISGAIQHLAGMKDSKVIVAINKDEDAPIFQVADYGLVGDLFQIVPALTAALE